jgi:hypothetical protein
VAVRLDEFLGPELAAVVMQNDLPDCGLPLCPKLMPKPGAETIHGPKQKQQRRNTTSGNVARSVKMPGIEG